MPPPAPKKILIADDHGIIRDGLGALLATERDLVIVGTAANGRDAIRAASDIAPDLIIMDIAMPLTNGPEAIVQIKKRHPEIRIMVLTFHTDDPHIFAALNSGADGYVLKDDSKSELLTAIRAVLAGKSFLSPAICNRVVQGYLATSGSLPSVLRVGTLDVLTSREREVLKLIAEGYRTREIGQMLCLSHKTIEKHRGNLMRKLKLRSAAAAAAYAIANGLVRP